MKHGILGLVVFLISILPGSVAAFDLGARAVYWMPNLDSTVQRDGNGLDGRNFSLTGDLDVQDKSWPMFSVFGGIGDHYLELVYTAVDYSGDETLGQDSNYGGAVYTGGTTVRYDLDYRSLDILYGYRFIDLDAILAGFSVHGTVNLKVVDGESRFKSGAQSTSDDFRAYIPMFGLDARLGILLDMLTARATVATMPFGGTNASELAGHLAFTPFPFVDIHVGYRVLLLRIEDGDLTLEHGMAGPYAGITISF